MTPLIVRLGTLFVGGVAAIAVVLTPGRESVGQVAKAPAAAGPTTYSAIHCIGCHGGPDTPSYRAYMADNINRPTEFCKLTEHSTWNSDDLHSLAYENIRPRFDDRGEPLNLAGRMQIVLARSPDRKDKEYRVETAAECLTCHAVDRKPGRIAGPTEKAGERFHTLHGVSCESCHGFAEQWFGPHVQAATWRKTIPADKSKLGLVDLRDPAIRAEKCASCHVGNTAEGKFVTHEMYAAGHPPLPPFELVTYSRDQPRHYFTPSENKALKALPKEDAEKYFHFRSEETENARAFAIGTVATFEASMRLLADDAEATAKRTGEMLDLAHFDCFACHHDLKVPSDRQARGYRGVPGRPIPRSVPTDSIRAVLKHANSATNIDAGLDQLAKAFDARPFGDPVQVAREARALAESAVAARGEVNKASFTAAEAQRLYDALAARAADPKSMAVDHDTAQQLVWGLDVLRRDLKPTATDSPAHAKLDGIVRLSLRDRERKTVEARLAPRLKQLYGFESKSFGPALLEWLK